MSGICGIVALGGSSPARLELAATIGHLETRGPDGSNLWQSGNVVLGHTLLATTPEALHEKLPLCDPETGCTITSDCRLDNREELIRELGVDRLGRVIGDGELILRAYLHWGDECPEMLLGDFAFAIWDPRHQRLFCARDHVGMRQLIYHHRPGEMFVFATEAEAVAASPQVRPRINRARIADYLDNLEGVDLTSTFFEGVYRLPPAHALTVDRERLAIRRYWRFTPVKELRLSSDAEYVEAFMGVFIEAVRCRMRSAGPTGVLLSGGIDSNAVAAVAADLLAEQKASLLTFTGVGPEGDGSLESAAIRAAVARPDFKPTLVDFSRLGPDLDDLAGLVAQCAEPFDAPMTLHRALYGRARDAGVRVILDGVGGDLVLNEGNVIGEMLRAGRFRKAVSAIKREWASWGFAPAMRQLLATSWSLTVPAPVRRLRRKLLRIRENRRLYAGKTIIRSNFAREVSLDQRRRQFSATEMDVPPFGSEHRVACLFHPHLVVGRERYDRIASSFAIEHRDPFLDRRVIDFCMTLPFDQLHRDGVGKAILRRAMAGRVPSEVIERREKQHLGWEFTQAVIPRMNPAILESPQLASVIEPEALLSLDPRAAKAVDRLRWFEIMSLAHWLARMESVVQPSQDQGE